MTVAAQQSNNLRSIAEQLKSAAQQTRSSFTDESRPQFDHRIVEEMRIEIRNISIQVADLGTELDNSLRMLD